MVTVRGLNADGALALVIVLDQFPLNLFRNQARSFGTEAAARSVAFAAIERGLDQQLKDSGKAFLYLPFMHSEDLADQLQYELRLDWQSSWHDRVFARMAVDEARNLIRGVTGN